MHPFLLDRPENPETPDQRLSVYGEKFVPVAGTFQADPVPVTFGEKKEVTIRRANSSLTLVTIEIDEDNDEYKLVYDYKNWPAGKTVQLIFQQVDSGHEYPIPVKMEAETQKLITYEPSGDSASENGGTGGKVEGSGSLAVRFYRGLLQPDTNYILALQQPEGEEFQQGITFPPCELMASTGKIRIKSIRYAKGEKAKKEGVINGKS